jgi:hypothetical protein
MRPKRRKIALLILKQMVRKVKVKEGPKLASLLQLLELVERRLSIMRTRNLLIRLMATVIRRSKPIWATL